MDPIDTDTTQDEPKRLAMICWSNDLDRVWPVMILATTGAASGLEVDVFFTFWGLRVLQRNDKRITGKNWMQKGESLVDRGGTDHLRLGKVNFGGMGTMMIKKLAQQEWQSTRQSVTWAVACASAPRAFSPRTSRSLSVIPGRGQL